MPCATSSASHKKRKRKMLNRKMRVTAKIKRLFLKRFIKLWNKLKKESLRKEFLLIFWKTALVRKKLSLKRILSTYLMTSQRMSLNECFTTKVRTIYQCWYNSRTRSRLRSRCECHDWLRDSWFAQAKTTFSLSV
jgi:hypothetical protein